MLHANLGDKFGGSSEIKNTVVYGGVPKQRQVRDLRSGVEIVIATPVRVIAPFDTLSLDSTDILFSSTPGASHRPLGARKHKPEASNLPCSRRSRSNVGHGKSLKK